MSIQENVKILQSEIHETALQHNRNPNDIILIAVSKTFSEELILQAYETGIRRFGENKVQEGIKKIENFKQYDMEWHLVGHLQSNKANKAVQYFNMIQSIDKLSTLEKVNQYAQQMNKKQEILIEVNTSGEMTKSGISPKEILEFIKSSLLYPYIKISGLMTIGPFTEDQSKIRDAFLLLRDLYQQCKEQFQNLDFKYLSMGMTDDFKLAIECGSNMLRIGRRIFGQRSYV